MVSVDKSQLGCVENICHKIHVDWVVQKYDTLYNSSVFCVPKKGRNSYIIAEDFRELNQIC